jgi:DNA-binding beta-propeller fold protein YncE
MLLAAERQRAIEAGCTMKTIQFLLGGNRTSSQPQRTARFRFVPSLVKFVLLAGLIISPDAEPMGLGGIGGGGAAPEFQSEVIDQFGGVQRPSRIAVADDGRIFVSDTLRGAVAIFESDGKRVGTLTGPQEPLGLAVSVLNRCGSFGCVCRKVKTTYVGDQSDGSVSVFEEGRLVRMLGAGAGEFIKPNGIAVTRAQVSYVVDSEARNIKIFAPNGTLQSTFGSRGWENGQVEYPIDIAMNEMTGELYVADYGNRRIAVFDLDGVWLRNMWAPDNDQGDPSFFRIAGIGIGPGGNLYVVDSALSSITILTPDGTLVDIIGYQLGTYWTGELQVPIDAATDGSQLYVTSSNDHMVKVFGVAP